MRKTLTALLLAASLPPLAMAAPQHATSHKMMHSEHHHQGARMFKDLNLSAEQREKIGKLMHEQRSDSRKITHKYLEKLPQADRDAMKQELKEARQQHSKDFRAILTAEQLKTFDARKAEMKKHWEERQAQKAEKAKQAQ